MAVATEVGGCVRERARIASCSPAARLGVLTGLLLATAVPVRADSYYLTVAGLGGEPDYEQRFIQQAADLDRVFKATGYGFHNTTLG